MAKQQKTRERVYDLVLREYKQHDLNGTPTNVCEEFSDPLVEELNLHIRVDCYAAKAATLAEATTKVADKNTRRRWIAGEVQSLFHESGKIWFVTTTGNPVAGAIDKEVYEQGI